MCLPLLELGVNDAIREALAADTDAFQYAVTLQLMQHQVSVDHTCTVDRLYNNNSDQVHDDDDHDNSKWSK